MRLVERLAGQVPPPWFFDPFVPDVVTVTGSPHTADLHEVPWEDVPTEVLLAEQQCWLLRPGARWHGFERVTDGYAMTDPNKLTLVTPGFNRQTGQYLDWGVPAPVIEPVVMAAILCRPRRGPRGDRRRRDLAGQALACLPGLAGIPADRAMVAGGHQRRARRSREVPGSRPAITTERGCRMRTVTLRSVRDNSNSFAERPVVPGSSTGSVGPVRF
jgi:hypothetical protein